MKQSKNYKKALETIGEKKEGLTIDEAVELALKVATTKFDSSVEVHMNLNLDTKHADQNSRGTLVLPHGTGKSVRVAAFVNEENKKKAEAAGADIAGIEDLIEQVQKGKMDFDIAVATPDCMKDLGKVAKSLGPKGLMPSPKAGTVTQDFENAIKELKKGKIEFKNDKTGIIHNAIGKVSFGKAKIAENLKVFLTAVIDGKPSGTKGQFIETIAVTTTMGPSLMLDRAKVEEECK